MFATEDMKSHAKKCLTQIFKVNHEGQVTDFRFFEILDLENVSIDTRFKSISCIQPELMKVIQWMCVTLSSKVNRQGHVIFSHIFDILDLENVRIDTKINFVSCLQPEIRKVMQKGVWPWFSRSCNKDRIFSLSPFYSLTLKTYPREIFSKNSDGKAKIQGGMVPPLGRLKGGFLPWGGEVPCMWYFSADHLASKNDQVRWSPPQFLLLSNRGRNDGPNRRWRGRVTNVNMTLHNREHWWPKKSSFLFQRLSIVIQRSHRTINQTSVTTKGSAIRHVGQVTYHPYPSINHLL